MASSHWAQRIEVAPRGEAGTRFTRRACTGSGIHAFGVESLIDDGCRAPLGRGLSRDPGGGRREPTGDRPSAGPSSREGKE